jgi:hypothetical protein
MSVEELTILAKGCDENIVSDALIEYVQALIYPVVSTFQKWVCRHGRALPVARSTVMGADVWT